MALIMLCGIPGSGKTTRAKELEGYLNELGKKVVLINEESLLIDKSKGYKDGHIEKMTRGSFKSSVERNLNKDTVVIVDSMNYIKGFRYELFCISKSAATPIAVLFCDTPLEMAIQFNLKNENKYEENILKSLASRFEAPNGKNRWDKPLFTVNPEDKTPLKELEEHINNKVVKPHTSNVPEVQKESNFIFQIDQISQDIINTITKVQNEGITTTNIKLPHSTISLQLDRKIPLATLRRYRSSFLKLVELSPPKSSEIGNSFISFIKEQLN
eukprot:TRINITY_DN17208_c0_g1_i1.p1 TRINITY_DN17208_c0_g1~~TRINITY_DN17208_c0_g1_i1.p1  ORF type:complete len:271 (+),score=72.10 TRINITY_DN17208_c0_g1_i1:30-842(+)